MQKEIFRDVPQYEGMYQVSNLGNVKSFKYKTERILKPCVNKVGYYDVVLCKDKKTKRYTVHQLVAMAFLNHKPCGYKLVVDHINDNPLDNRVDNLQIITQRENSFKTQGKYTSKYKGVSFNTKTKKFVSQIYYNKKTMNLGFFDCELAASLAYENKLKELNNE